MCFLIAVTIVCGLGMDDQGSTAYYDDGGDEDADDDDDLFDYKIDYVGSHVTWR